MTRHTEGKLALSCQGLAWQPPTLPELTVHDTYLLPPFTQLEVEPEQDTDHVLCLRLGGQLQLATRQALQQAVSDLLGPDTRRVVLDFTDVEFLSQEGAGMLLKLYQLLKTWETELVLVGVTGRAAETLERMAITRLVPCADSLYAAKTAPFAFEGAGL
jgi:anti-anti-sigma factor